ncbi:methyltransferase domain-containing protein [Salipiger sp. IMCC34102]|uniref:SAM-dependent methyltransferase n=1 Tax=Salipiger sp. IMCC34102 TaxID=2510647 RepID=UPI00101CEC4F|nr:SAM-dependent methyltransferase [Salipiger sp. IMCC34102]RYH01348.1 methyltransferase domain-containing protein [Salipiger sp. IMCC34102]
MRAADLAHLRGLYAGTDDPWDFRASPYEAKRFAAVAEALPRESYAAALELGCGNGELARRIAPRCGSYTGLDAVPAALEAARKAVPAGCFVEGFLPCALPAPPQDSGYDLILLSEILYFMGPAGIAEISQMLDRDHPAADVISVTWRGATGHALSGDEALIAFADASRRSSWTSRLTQGYRIAVFSPFQGSQP